MNDAFVRAGQGRDAGTVERGSRRGNLSMIDCGRQATPAITSADAR